MRNAKQKEAKHLNGWNIGWWRLCSVVILYIHNNIKKAINVTDNVYFIKCPFQNTRKVSSASSNCRIGTLDWKEYYECRLKVCKPVFTHRYGLFVVYSIYLKVSKLCKQSIKYVHAVCCYQCVCVCARACVRVCVRLCVCVVNRVIISRATTLSRLPWFF